jgi:cyclase
VKRGDAMNVNRRQWLLAGLGATRLLGKPGVPAPLFDRGFARVTQIADGVYATIADTSKGAQCVSNGGVIAGRDATLIVEGHMQPAGAALEIEVARAIGKGPVRAAVDTHFHFDHSFGNLAYADQAIPIMAHARVTSLMKERYAALKGVNKASLLAPVELKVANAADEADKAHKQGDLELFKMMYAAIDATTLAFPTELLGAADLPKRIDLGGLTAVIEFHPGHTETDLLIHIPERDVVFTGDLLFNRAYPVSVDADMIAWRKVLDHLAGYRSRTQFVPGHGSVCGVQVVREQVALMDDLRAHAERMIRGGVTAEEAEQRYVVPKAFQSYRNHAWGWTVGAAMQSFYSKLAPRRG